MKTSPRSVALLVGLVLVAQIGVTRATITTFTDRASFLAALGGISSTTETFDIARTFVLGDNLYNGVNYRVVGTAVGGNNISGGILNGDEFTSNSIDYLFATPIFALGADFNGARTASGFNWIINGISTPIFGAAPGTGFFGVISTDPFSLVDVSSGPPSNEIYSLDNFTFAANVPEPTTAMFCGCGFLGAILLRRRTRTR